MIKGKEYSFEDMDCVINGIQLEGFEDVNYGVTYEKANVHGRGNRPVRRQRGKKDSTPGRLVILQTEFERLQRATPKGSDPTDWAPFDMVISYAPPGGDLVVDVVPYCEVTGFEKGINNAEGHRTIELQLITDIPKLNV